MGSNEALRKPFQSQFLCRKINSVFFNAEKTCRKLFSKSRDSEEYYYIGLGDFFQEVFFSRPIFFRGLTFDLGLLHFFERKTNSTIEHQSVKVTKIVIDF